MACVQTSTRTLLYRDFPLPLPALFMVMQVTGKGLVVIWKMLSASGFVATVWAGLFFCDGMLSVVGAPQRSHLLMIEMANFVFFPSLGGVLLWKLGLVRSLFAMDARAQVPLLLCAAFFYFWGYSVLRHALPTGHFAVTLSFVWLVVLCLAIAFGKFCLLDSRLAASASTAFLCVQELAGGRGVCTPVLYWAVLFSGLTTTVFRCVHSEKYDVHAPFTLILCVVGCLCAQIWI